MEPSIDKHHIECTPGVCNGRPRIAGHRIRVQDIVLWTELGRSPDDIVAQFPQLSLAQVHAALSYYYHHQDEINRQIREDESYVEAFRSNQGAGPLFDVLGAK